VAFVETLAPFFADFGGAGTLAGAAVVGILDKSSVIEGADGTVTQGPTFLMAAPAATPAPGASLVLNGVTYTVRRALAEPPDGALMRLVLTRS
jgi:hypothetical protein